MRVLIKELLADNLAETGSTEILDVQLFQKYFESYEGYLFTKLNSVLPNQSYCF